MIDFKDISFVVQGGIDKENTPLCLKSIREHMPGAEIILSTWEGAQIDGLDYDRVVFCKDPGAVIAAPKFNYLNNINRQLISTVEGLKLAERKYAMKLRTDNILTSSDFLKFFDKFPKRCAKFLLFKERLIVASLFSRKYFGIPNPFRISDWFTFGLTEDVKKFYFNITPVEEPAFSEYFSDGRLHAVKGCPSPYHFHRFTTEQYYPLDCFQKFFPEIKMQDLADFNAENIAQSDICLANNFIFLEYRQHGIYLGKKKWKTWSLDEGAAPDLHWDGFIRHYVFQKDYKKFCDPAYRLPFFDYTDIKRKFKKLIKKEK
ncbi:hypothetical protein Dip510_001911 [Elusimicrobium posterum]|uniref:WavE lipopolysaccharide synthesis family protein n=1 Tax=Elusimicrobium posterum TaxID=3116653 RepID=UPI003C72E1C1